MAGLQQDNVVNADMSIDIMKNETQHITDQDPALLKSRQDLLAKEYRELARNLSEIRSDKAKHLLTKLKSNKPLTMFQNMFDERDAVFERMRKAVNKRYEYESDMVKNVTKGEIRNVHLQFYNSKNMLQQDLIKEVHEQIADLEREYHLCRYPAVTVRQTVVRNLQIANNLPESSAITGLSPQEAKEDLDSIRGGKAIDMVEQICETELWGDSLDSSRKGVISVPSHAVEEPKNPVVAVPTPAPASAPVATPPVISRNDNYGAATAAVLPHNIQTTAPTMPVVKREYERDQTTSEPRPKKPRSIPSNHYEPQPSVSYNQTPYPQMSISSVTEQHMQRSEPEPQFQHQPQQSSPQAPVQTRQHTSQQAQYASQHLPQSQILPPPPRPSQTLVGPPRPSYHEPKESHMTPRLPPPPPPPPAPVTYNAGYNQGMHLPPPPGPPDRHQPYAYYGSYPIYQPQLNTTQRVQLPPFNSANNQAYTRQQQQLSQYGYLLPPPPPPPPQPPMGDEQQKGDAAHRQHGVPMQNVQAQYPYAYTYDGRYSSQYQYNAPPPSQVR